MSWYDSNIIKKALDTPSNDLLVNTSHIHNVALAIVLMKRMSVATVLINLLSTKFVKVILSNTQTIVVVVNVGAYVIINKLFVDVSWFGI